MDSEKEFYEILKDRNLKLYNELDGGEDKYFIGLNNWDEETIRCCGFIFVFHSPYHSIDEKFKEIVTTLNKNKLIEEKT